MNAETDVRREIAEIEDSCLSSQQKARRLLRLAQGVEPQKEFAAEIRSRARQALHTPDGATNFDFPPQPTVNWRKG